MVFDRKTERADWRNTVSAHWLTKNGWGLNKITTFVLSAAADLAYESGEDPERFARRVHMEWPQGYGPVDNPMTVQRLREETRKHIATFKNNFETYLSVVTDQDAYMEPIVALGPILESKFEAWFEFWGNHPTEDVITIFSEEERKVFGKTVKESL